MSERNCLRCTGVKRHRLFTLIELLVVIAIIAILAAILLPALNSARQRGHSTTCVNNLKQMMMLLTQYADDNEGVIPLFNNSDRGWIYLLAKRQTTWSKMPDWTPASQCPSLPFVYVEQDTDYVKMRKRWITTYGMFYQSSGNYMHFKKGTARTFKGKTGYALDDSFYTMSFSKRPIIGDSFRLADWQNYGVRNQANGIYGGPNTSGGDTKLRMHARHAGAAQLGFHDGHADAVTGEELHKDKIIQKYVDANGNLVDMGKVN